MSEYSEGICNDGAAILKDGDMMTVENIVSELNMIPNLASLIRQMSASLQKNNIKSGLRRRAISYLAEHGLLGNILRQTTIKGN